MTKAKKKMPVRRMPKPLQPGTMVETEPAAGVEEVNEARKAFDEAAAKAGSGSVSQIFIRSYLFSFIYSPGRTFDEIGKANRSLLNGICYIALVAAILVFASFFFQTVFAEAKLNMFKETIGFAGRLIAVPLTSAIYDSIIILLVMGIALFMKNVSLKKMTERPYLDNFFNSMAFTSAVMLIGAIPFASLLGIVLKNAQGVDADTSNTLFFLVANIPLALMVWQLVLMYMVTKKYLGLNVKHALIALIPAAIPLLNQLYLLLGELSKMSGT